MASTEFVGREKELAKLSTSFDKLNQEQFSLVFIRGAAGSGKTALVNHFREVITQRYPETLVGSGFCNAQTGLGDPYLPFRRILDELLESSEDKKHKRDHRNDETLKSMLAFSAKCVVEFAPDLIGALVPGGTIVQGLSKYLLQEAHVSEKLAQLSKPENQKQELAEARIQEQYTNLVQALSKNYKLILIIDDVHWADEASVSLLYHLAQSLKNERVMLICLYREADVLIGRDGKRHPMEHMAHELQRIFGDIWIDLDKVNPEERRRFTNQLIDLEPNKLSQNFREAIFEITNGNALFVQELLRNLQENGNLVKDEHLFWIENGTTDWSIIPPRVEGIIRERINRLENFLKEILSVASIQGKDFLVQAVSSMLKISDRDLVRKLSEVLDKQHKLVQEGKIQRVEGKALFYFGFTDTLIHSYVYNDLSMSEKMLLSNDIAEILEAQYGGNAAEIAVDLAHLYQVAGNDEKAAQYALQAGKNAFRLSAYRQASQHFRAVLQNLEQLPANDQTRKFKLEALKSLSLSLKPTEGWNAPEVTAFARQAVDLGYEMKEFKSISPVMFSLWSTYLMQLELGEAKTYALKYLALGRELGEAEMLLQADLALANTTYWQGDLTETNQYLQDFFASYDPIHHAGQLEQYGQDPHIIAMLFASMTDFMLGDITKGDKVIQDLVETTRKLSHPFSQAIALQALIFSTYYLADFEALANYAEQMIALSGKFGFIFYLGVGKMFKSLVLGKAGQYQEAISLLETGYFREVSQDGSKLLNSFYGLFRAEVELWNGYPARALESLEKNLQISRSSGEMCFYAELLRLKSQALSASGSRLAAQATLMEAITYAQQAKMVTQELKALLDLSELDPAYPQIKPQIQNCLERFISIRPYSDITRAQQLLNPTLMTPE